MSVLRELWATDPLACVLLATGVLLVLGVAYTAVRGATGSRRPPPTADDWED